MNRCKNILKCFLMMILLTGLTDINSLLAAKGTFKELMVPMACNDLVHVSLDTNCLAVLAPSMVLEDMIGVNADYAMIVYNANGTAQTDLSFDHTDINKRYDYKVWHIATGNSCWGKLLVEDKYPPQLVCSNDTVRCGAILSPYHLGYPIPSWISVTIDSLDPNHFVVHGWDKCGKAYLSFTDYTYNNTCDSAYLRKIVRAWKAEDAYGNVNYCNDTICIIKPTVLDIVYPHDYDGFDLPPLNCNLLFPKLPNGNPHPDFTGWPVPKSCSTLNASFSDLKIPVCGNTYKVLRRWVILDWCTGLVLDYNQIIKVIDDVAPIVESPKDITMGMQVYSCRSEGKLPAPLSVIDCNSWTYDVFTSLENPIPGLPPIVSKQYIEYDKNLKCFFLRGAPEGRIWINYIVEDACGNITKDTIEVGVVDDLVPIPVCDQKTVVSLGADGTAKVFAETFDDGSLDNCGINTFRVRRMVDSCYSGTDDFGPYVSFCCRDVGEIVMVAMEVTDFYRNKNTCMVEVTVQDKEPPVIIPPTDITVHCDFPIDFDDLSIFGYLRTNDADRKSIIIPDSYYAGKNYVAGIDGWVYDNCEVTVTERVEKNIQCNSGSIHRIFEATDRQGLVTIKYQKITLINTSPFTRNDIIWPNSVEINTCNNVMTHPDHTGYPIFRNTTCAQVAANYDDLKLAVLDSTCYKILRKWVVIDWCQYDRITGAGIWDTTQIIAVKSSEPPTLESCEPKEFCDPLSFYDNNSRRCMGSYSLVGVGHDDCTEDPNLIWSYKIDENNDGSFGVDFSGQSTNGVLPLGTHKIRWNLRDQCGNTSVCDQLFTIKDCKKPTPYCINGVVTVVMHTNGEVTVWAKDFNLASFDNCTRPENLKYSFSADTTHTSITYNCDSLERQGVITKIVRIYVTDEYGNQEYCETSIRIQDNNNVCPGTNPGFSLSGKVQRENKDAIPGTYVILMDNLNNTEQDRQISDLQGTYTFKDLKINDFHLKASKNDDLTNGVSTLDIVLIQRHILGVKTLNSPYKILAADVNNSNSLTAKDISDIRRAILGVITEWPNQTPVWKFINGTKPFANQDQPWDASYKFESADLTDVLDELDFTGIKTGDIDQSAEIQFGNANNRGFEKYIISVEMESIDAHSSRVNFYSSHSAALDGIQLGLQTNSGATILGFENGILEIASENYLLEEDKLKLSWATDSPQQMNAGEKLFSVLVHHPKAMVNANLNLNYEFKSELYIHETAFPISLKWLNAEIVQPTSLMYAKLQPNPFADQALLLFEMPEAGEVEFKVYNLAGKLIYSKQMDATKGNNKLNIRKTDISSTGLMYFVISSAYGNVSEKMLILEN
ncbi:MAG: hypothetical protein IPM92_03120 [Saprospiraceae bacterium]|nr:hypothetical protein [Saprospiraceae bacterium]